MTSTWFQQQLRSKTSSPRRRLRIGEWDLSAYARGWPSIRRQWDDLRPARISMALAPNPLAPASTFEARLRTSVLPLEIDFGYTHPQSGDEWITLFAGEVTRFSSNRQGLRVNAVDRLKSLVDRQVGARENPVRFMEGAGHSPASIAWTLITCYGAWSALRTDANPDLNYSSFHTWGQEWRSMNTRMQAEFRGLPVNEALRILAHQTHSAIFMRNNRLHFMRFLNHTPSSVRESEALLSTQVDVNEEELFNRFAVLYAYQPSSRRWSQRVTLSDSASIVRYGLREHVERSRSVWYLNRVDALDLADRNLFVRSQPKKTAQLLGTWNESSLRIGELLRLQESSSGRVHETHWRILAQEMDLERSTVMLSLDSTYILNPFTLGSSQLGDWRARLT